LKPIKSRHGLTRCTACRAHIRAAERPSATRCPFCGADMQTGQRLISMPAGRSGAVAGALLAFSLTACGGADPGPAQEPTEQHADDNTNADEPVSSDDPTPPPSDDQYADDPADDNAAVAEYGMAMPEDQYEEEPADSPRPTPRYGLPPGRR